ncbi:hypothetical protein G9F72_024100 [Clostridium estertheticum]|uniref:hypothetical protein n=1 Tax=Clostridium estertheticum TaxID=238834 RepID=UPI0013E8FC1C|nr:hypothetical protein [Clostridium estertheticum]MBZ9689384.1 hypothetical protein [Clostridium estertheticum]
MEEALFLIQNRLYTKYLNKSLGMDEYKFDLLSRYVGGLITTYLSNTKLSKEPLFLEFDEKSVNIYTTLNLHIVPGNLHVYLEIKNNIIIKIEASIVA